MNEPRRPVRVSLSVTHSFTATKWETGAASLQPFKPGRKIVPHERDERRFLGERDRIFRVRDAQRGGGEQEISSRFSNRVKIKFKSIYLPRGPTIRSSISDRSEVI